MENNSNVKIAMRISVVSIFVNIFLSVFKLIAGIVGKSGAMISDAVHSASDVFSTIIVMIGITLSGKRSDAEHQYGHERMECVSAIILAIVLGVTGIGIGWEGIENIFFKNSDKLQTPTLLALIAAIISIIVKEGMYWYTIWGAKKVNSASLKADAWHHRSDALSSIGSFIGVFGSMCGVKILDPLASTIIAFMILKAAYDIVKDALDKMVDKSCDREIVEKMETVISSQDGVKHLDLIKTRLFGNRIYVDIEVSADGNLTLKEGHKIAQSVHNAIESSFPLVKHCMVHINPYGEIEEPDNEK